MAHFFFFAALVCMLGVLASFIRGMFAMGKDTEKDHRKSNKMMRMRVLFQGLAILFLFLSYFSRH